MYASFRKDKRQALRIWSGPFATSARTQAFSRWHSSAARKRGELIQQGTYARYRAKSAVRFWRLSAGREVRLHTASQDVLVARLKASLRRGFEICRAHAKRQSQGRQLVFAFWERTDTFARCTIALTLHTWMAYSSKQRVTRQIVMGAQLHQVDTSARVALQTWSHGTARRRRMRWLFSAATTHWMAVLLAAAASVWRDALARRRHARCLVMRIHSSTLPVLARACLHAISRLLAVRRRAHGLLQRRTVAGGRAAFLQWHSFALSLRRTRGGVDEAASTGAKALLRFGYSAWCAYVENRHQKQQHAVVLGEECSVSAWRRCTAHWRAWAQKQRAFRVGKAIAAQRAHDWCLEAFRTCFLVAWAGCTQHRQQKMVMARQALCAWYDFTAYRRRRRAIAIGASLRWVQSVARNLLAAWFEHTVSVKGQDRLVLVSDHYYARKLQACAVFTWRYGLERELRYHKEAEAKWQWLLTSVSIACTSAWKAWTGHVNAEVERKVVATVQRRRDISRRRSLHVWLARAVYGLVARQRCAEQSKRRSAVCWWSHLTKARRNQHGDCGAGAAASVAASSEDAGSEVFALGEVAAASAASAAHVAAATEAAVAAAAADIAALAAASAPPSLSLQAPPHRKRSTWVTGLPRVQEESQAELAEALVSPVRSQEQAMTSDDEGELTPVTGARSAASAALRTYAAEFAVLLAGTQPSSTVTQNSVSALVPADSAAVVAGAQLEGVTSPEPEVVIWRGPSKEARIGRSHADPCSSE
eukprot:TRINITY_DN55357_c0_g1_i1.p1 TRINITY_DN55357_c0_g1~~TRINITY_DN55357_c0_g1_i1.p1  ORF type:complete len:791 (-),score=99.88 TRINITY_DN55357_c0_g1_i1:62-2341(-)